MRENGPVGDWLLLFQDADATCCWPSPRFYARLNDGGAAREWQEVPGTVFFSSQQRIGEVRSAQLSQQGGVCSHQEQVNCRSFVGFCSRGFKALEEEPLLSVTEP